MKDESEYEPFREIAKKKGVEITFLESGKSRTTHEMSSTDEIHLDINMVEQSIRNAIERTGKSGQKTIQAKLERLLQSGSDSQKVDFVFGSGTYYFPEDIEVMAAISRKDPLFSKSKCHKVCDNVCWMACMCIPKTKSQECSERCKQVCQVVCD